MPKVSTKNSNVNDEEIDEEIELKEEESSTPEGSKPGRDGIDSDEILRQAIQFQQLSPCPEAKANIFSKLTFWWMNGLMKSGYKKALEMTDLWDLREAEKAHNISIKFEERWNLEKMNSKGFVPGPIAAKQMPWLLFLPPSLPSNNNKRTRQTKPKKTKKQTNSQPLSAQNDSQGFRTSLLFCRLV